MVLTTAEQMVDASAVVMVVVMAGQMAYEMVCNSVAESAAS